MGEDFDDFYEQICCLRREKVHYTHSDDSLHREEVQKSDHH